MLSENSSPLTQEKRRAREGHDGAVLWLTGLSASGKTTLALAVERAFIELGERACTLDGDTLRRGLNVDLGYSREDRRENIRRAAEVARLLSVTGTIVIAALISPAAEDRAYARKIATADGQVFIEIYLDTPLEVCETRDPKGLYRRARAGELRDFTGIDSPYEPPSHPEMTVSTHHEALMSSVERIVALVQLRLTAGKKHE